MCGFEQSSAKRVFLRIGGPTSRRRHSLPFGKPEALVRVIDNGLVDLEVVRLRRRANYFDQRWGLPLFLVIISGGGGKCSPKPANMLTTILYTE